MLRTVLVGHSQTPPMWLASAVLKTFTVFFSKVASHSFFVNLIESCSEFIVRSNKVVPLSHRSLHTEPRRLTNCLRTLMNASVDRDVATSRWIVQEYRQMKMQPHRLSWDLHSFMRNGQKKSISTYMNGGHASSLSSGRLTICWYCIICLYWSGLMALDQNLFNGFTFYIIALLLKLFSLAFSQTPLILPGESDRIPHQALFCMCYSDKTP